VPRDSIGRRVARAASIGGSRSYKSRTPYAWYGVLLAICVIGLALVALSRHELQQSAATSTTTTTTPESAPPTITDHWKVALSVDICGDVVNLPRSAPRNSGIITEGNGVVDIKPARAGADASKYEGAKATLGNFLTQENVSLTDTSLTLPSSVGKLAGTYDNGRKCGSSSGRVQTLIWGSPSASAPFAPITTNQDAIHYGNGELYMVAFVPKGAVVPRPPGHVLVASFLKPPTTTTTSTSSTTTTTTSSKSGTTSTSTSTSTSTTTVGPTVTTKPSTTSSTG